MATTVPTISALHFYPVKGCAAVSASEAELTDAGLRHDRTFMVVAADGTFRSQRTTPRMAVIRPEISTDGTALTLRAPGAEPCRVSVDLERERTQVVMFHQPYQAIDQGAAVADWLGEVLGETARLVRVPPEARRVTDGQTPGTAAFADGHAVLVTSRSSLEALNERIARSGEPPLPMDRFRPNIVVDGWQEPHTEDRVRELAAGDVGLGYAKIAVRCAVTTVDQRTGVRSGPEPLRALARYRRAAQGGVAFGAKFAVVRPGKVVVGSEVTVARWGRPEL